MRNLRKMAAAISLAVFLTGCSARLVDFTMISTKNIDLSKAATFQRGKMRVEGKDQISMIIVIPTGVLNIKEAIDRAIESVPGAVALVDGVITMHSWYIPYIYGRQSYVVEGTPLVDPALAAGKFQSQFMIAEMDRNGKLKDLKYVTEEQYMEERQKVIDKKS